VRFVGLLGRRAGNDGKKERDKEQLEWEAC